jgi:serine protease Do
MTGNTHTDTTVVENNREVNFENKPLIRSALSPAGETDFETAAAAVTPAVVYIRVTYAGQENGDNDNGPNQGVQMASGSGVIISPDGYIVTNNHVVDKASKIEITTNDRRNFSAKVIGTDPNTDLALIKIDASNLPVVKFGNSDDVKVGEWVLAVGNPFNLTSTVTAGIVSAKGRGIGIIGHGEDQDQQESPFGQMPLNQREPTLNTGIESFIQTDAAINPGNSGGALVNTKGELIGINSAIASHTGSYEGYGFAIPINLAEKVLNDIEKYGAVKRGYIGVTYKELNQDAADALHIGNTVGLYVDQVGAGSGAELAGLQHGDIITSVDGKTVYESSDLQEPVARLQPGDSIDLTVLRGNEVKHITVTLKAEAGNLGQNTVSNASPGELYNKLGATFEPLTPDQKSKFNINSGVMVTEVQPGLLFDNVQIPVGSVIASVNKQPVNSSDDISDALTNLKNGKLLISGYYPDGTKFNNVIEQQDGQ